MHSKLFISRPRHRGFTVIESAVALVIIAILISIGAPSFGSWIASTRVLSSAESITSGLRVARTEALKRNAPVDFVFTDEDTKVATAAASGTGRGWQARTTESPAQVLQGRSATETPSRIQVRSTAATVRFNGAGRSLPLGAVVTIDVTSSGTPSRPLRVVVTAGGAIRSCDPAVDAADPRGC